MKARIITTEEELAALTEGSVIRNKEWGSTHVHYGMRATDGEFWAEWRVAYDGGLSGDYDMLPAWVLWEGQPK